MLFCPRFWLPGGEAQVGEKGALRGGSTPGSCLCGRPRTAQISSREAEQDSQNPRNAEFRRAFRFLALERTLATPIGLLHPLQNSGQGKPASVQACHPPQLPQEDEANVGGVGRVLRGLG